ncbi:2,5-dichloro-2,5-cyclohexadiene-1,4-diol dehydrogenase [Myxococcus stipitatus DSM 14675]|uniref:2,5-dichloro-2,5-cyclohexadiene-1,4-diol dehydrogenase n=1 Tax=Myxococcus stipitatus (strain DSM 14675 / JCM 12634 / Mx s8) TaxID=1278073 RepID=L7UKQ1_MYXSD|nr:glucose 1-dehydrogenase [Myxococcus stipitatus]AGC47019.1 2,5-dichloro-2,5-cyclohexadiene-1,4-diol dehydrogenase [Myxococcus stipitatus DSM 14675]
MRMFENKVVLVTGGSSGIGRAAALAFAQEGARVVVSARRVDPGEEVVREIRARGGEARFIRCDVSDESQVEALVRQTVEAHGRLDCAFNNAGAMGRHLGPLHSQELTDFDETVNVHMRGVWLCMKHEVRAMLAQSPRGGVLVNTSSVAGLGGVGGQGFYPAAKAGVIALTKTAAQEYARLGIRVNTLVAGSFETPMLDGAVDQLTGGDAGASAALREQIKQFIPMGRIGDASEAAAAALWLCSEASSFVTGHSMIVDGGVSSLLR